MKPHTLRSLVGPLSTGDPASKQNARSPSTRRPPAYTKPWSVRRNPREHAKTRSLKQPASLRHVQPLRYRHATPPPRQRMASSHHLLLQWCHLWQGNHRKRSVPHPENLHQRGNPLQKKNQHLQRNQHLQGNRLHRVHPQKWMKLL